MARTKLQDEKERVSKYFLVGVPESMLEDKCQQGICPSHTEGKKIPKGEKLCFKVFEMLNH